MGHFTRVLLLMACFFSADVGAELNYGFLAGTIYSRMWGDSVYIGNTYRFGPIGSLYANYRFPNQSKSVQVELCYAEKGGEVNSNPVYSTFTQKYRYIETPILLRWELRGGFSYAGISPAYLLQAKVSSDSVARNLLIKEFDASVLTGLGIIIGSVEIHLRYHLGLIAQNEDSSGISQKTGGYSALLGIPLKR